MAIAQGTALRVTVTTNMPGGTVAQNVFYLVWQGPGSGVEVDMVDDMVAWAESMWETMEDVIADSVTLDNMEIAKWVGPAPGTWVTFGEAALTFVGLAIEQALPNGVALVIRAATSVAKHLVRKYIAGVSEGHVDEDVWVAGAVTTGLAYLQAWLFGPQDASGDYDVGTWSRSDSLFLILDLAGALSTIPGYQRRRKPGVGI